MNLENIAFLIIRIGVAFVYLYAAYMNTRNAASWQWTVDHTAILFRGTALEQNRSFIKLSAFAGMIMMYGGALSVLLGLEGRIGGLTLAVFTASGIVIHRREQMDAEKNTRKDLLAAVPDEWRGTLAAMAWSAYAAHFSSLLKNIILVAIFLFFVLEGTGHYSASDHMGALLGLQSVTGSE